MNKIGFKKTDIAFILALAKGLGGCRQHGEWFRNLREEDVTLDSMEAENDMLNIEMFSILMREVDAQSIVPGRKKIEYALFAPVCTPGSYWQPDDVDLTEAGAFAGLSEAFSEIYAQFARDFTHDNALAVAFEFSWPVKEEV